MDQTQNLQQAMNCPLPECRRGKISMQHCLQQKRDAIALITQKGWGIYVQLTVRREKLYDKNHLDFFLDSTSHGCLSRVFAAEHRQLFSAGALESTFDDINTTYASAAIPPIETKSSKSILRLG
ncbi:MAG: hypothetical protein AB9866_02325 [Syntrophobacteraceae bacterium]